MIQQSDTIFHPTRKSGPEEGHLLTEAVHRFLTCKTNWTEFSTTVDELIKHHPWLVDELSGE